MNSHAKLYAGVGGGKRKTPAVGPGLQVTYPIDRYSLRRFAHFSSAAPRLLQTSDNLAHTQSAIGRSPATQ
jgi:hypothetical protein